MQLASIKVEGMKNIKSLSAHQLAKITLLQKEMHEKFRHIPREGVIVRYSKKKFIVYSHVFWPFDDSKPLVRILKVKPNEEVLDVGTGSGVLAILAAYTGAKKVVALDNNPQAVKNAQINTVRHGFSEVIDIRLSDVFSALKRKEMFDVIIANLPFRNLPAIDAVQRASWDEGLRVHSRFFTHVKDHLKKNGRIYLAQANYGAVNEILTMAQVKGFVVTLMSEKNMPDNDPRIFYAFKLKLHS